MPVWIENISYLITFVITAGISALGIMVSLQVYKHFKKPVFSALLYQQIFLFSFLLYSIWGNMTLRLIIGDLNLNEDLSSKLAFFFPMIGTPFIMVSWFMLIKFAYNLNGYKLNKVFTYSYFPTLVVVVFSVDFLIFKEIIRIPANADLFVVRILTAINAFINLLVLIPFLKPNRVAQHLKEIGYKKEWITIFLMALVAYSFALSFINIFGFISICIAIILLFASSVFFPVIIRTKTPISEEKQSINFDAFCKHYDISRRESEIILEICSGKSNKAIAEKLFITLQTVKDHNHRIYTKIGVKSRVQLANLLREKTGR